MPPEAPPPTGPEPSPSPFLTFAVVVHRDQARVEECVRSILGQAPADVEVLAVDDASPDRSPAVLRRVAEEDRRLRVQRLEERAGFARARTLALEEAAGRHFWLVEATDLLPPGAVAAVLEHLRATSPDVLVVDHRRIDALGRTQAGRHGALLAALAREGEAPLDERPGYASLAEHAWDKVLRTEHLRTLGVRFSEGLHGELTVTWPALLTAARLAATPVPAYVRREPANAETPGGSPLDVFEHYDAVLGLAAARDDVPDRRRALLLAAMLRHERALFHSLPAGERHPFFAAMADAWRRHAGTELPPVAGRLPQLQARLVEQRSYAAFRALERSLEAYHGLERRRTVVSRRKGRLLGAARRERLERRYRARRRAPLDPDLAVFAAYWYRGYTCNPRAIYERARELVPNLRGVWVTDPAAAGRLPEGVEHVAPNTPEYYDVLARATWFVNNVNFPNHLRKRPGQVHVMTHHGTPLKQMGLDLKRVPAGARMDTAGLMRRCARWDYSVSANPFSTLIWERVYPTRYESLETGYPRNDQLAAATPEDVVRARAQLGLEPGQTAVLYAPTHRELQSEHVPLLDVDALARRLGPGHVILSRRHYFYGADPVLARLHRSGPVRDVASHPSVEELCLAADVLVTDYSSIMFDYAVLDRPIIIHAPDWEAYRMIRGTYFDLLAEPPGPVARTEAEVAEAIVPDAARVAEAEGARAAFRARFCALEDGHAAERVVRRVWLGERQAAAAPVPSSVR